MGVSQTRYPLRATQLQGTLVVVVGWRLATVFGPALSKTQEEAQAFPDQVRGTVSLSQHFLEFLGIHFQDHHGQG